MSNSRLKWISTPQRQTAVYYKSVSIHSKIYGNTLKDFGGPENQNRNGFKESGNILVTASHIRRVWEWKLFEAPNHQRKRILRNYNHSKDVEDEIKP